MVRTYQAIAKVAAQILNAPAQLHKQQSITGSSVVAFVYPDSAGEEDVVFLENSGAGHSTEVTWRG